MKVSANENYKCFLLTLRKDKIKFDQSTYWAIYFDSKNKYDKNRERKVVYHIFITWIQKEAHSL